jgi:N-acyl-L-homoserine lactone synthetase
LSQPIDRPSRPQTPAGSDADEIDLVFGDDLAGKILGDLEPLRFEEATQPTEREACFRLRYRAVIEMAMAEDRFYEGIERDEFDEDAVQILGRDPARIVATARLVLPVDGRPLPTEDQFGLRISAEGGVVELGRVVVDPLYRGDGHSVFMGLAAQAWLSMRARGFTTAIAATPARLIALFEALGFAVTVLGPPRTWWGEERYPIVCDGRPAIPGIGQRWLASEVQPPPASPQSGGGTQ